MSNVYVLQQYLLVAILVYHMGLARHVWTSIWHQTTMVGGCFTHSLGNWDVGMQK